MPHLRGHNPLMPAVFYKSSESMPEVEDGSVRLVFTSPPYWNLKDYGHQDQIGGEAYEDYLSRLARVWGECHRVACAGAVLGINVRHIRFKKTYYPLAFDIQRTMPDGWVLWDVLFWYIPNALPQSHHYQERLFESKVEFLLLFIKGPPDAYICHKPRIEHSWAAENEHREEKLNPDGRCLGNLLRIPAYRPPTLRSYPYHIAAFPEELPALFIHTFTDVGDTVLDPFLGSGTTVKVALNMGRQGVGYEINPDFKGCIDARIGEHWEVPDWKDIDNLWALKRSMPRNPGRGLGDEQGGILSLFGEES